MSIEAGTPERHRSRELPSLPALTRTRGRWVDLVVLAAVPLGVAGLFFLPEPTKHELVLVYTEPTLVSAFTSHYMHLSAGHLISNLVGYLALVPVAYLLSLASGRRHAFFVAFTTFLLVIPFTLSLLNVLLVRPRVGYGFSGVVMAFLGFLPLAIFWHLEACFDSTLDIGHSPLLYFVGLGVISVWAVPATPLSVASAITATLAALLYLGSLHRDLTSVLRHGSRRRLTSVRQAELVAVGVLLFFCFPVAAFPGEPAGPGTVLNLYSHLLGYGLGFMASFITFGLVGVGSE